MGNLVFPGVNVKKRRFPEAEAEGQGGAGPYVKVFVYDGSSVTETISIDAFPGGLTHGANVAAGRF